MKNSSVFLALMVCIPNGVIAMNRMATPRETLAQAEIMAQAIIDELDPPKVALFDAACEGDVAEVQRLLHEGVSPLVGSLRILQMKTPLMGAIEANRWGTQQLLMKHTLAGQVVITDAKNWTLLHYAAHHSAAHLIAPLVNAGADVNAPGTHDSQRPLRLAIKAKPHVNKLLTVMALLAHGAKVEEMYGITVCSASKDDNAIAELLQFYKNKQEAIEKMLANASKECVTEKNS